MTTTTSSSTDSVTTGTLTTTGSRTYIVGTASGIDTSALVDAAYSAKTAAADKIDLQVQNNENIISSYSQLQTLSNNLISSLSTLRAAYLSDDSSVYSQLTSYLSSSDGTEASNYMSVNVDSGASKGTYTVNVEQLATAMKISSSAQSGKTTALDMSGVFSLSAADGTAADITVTSDMSLQDIADAINAQSATTGVGANIVKTSDSSYTLVLTGTDTGEVISASAVSGGDVLQSLGVTDSSGNFANIVQDAQDAKILFDGQEVTSSSNTFSDVVNGLSITIGNSSPGKTVTVDVDYDYSQTKSAIEDFITAYNNLRDYITTNQQVNSDGSIPDSAVLHNDSIMEAIDSQLSSILDGSFGSSSGFGLASMGITLDSNNDLQVSDETTLNNALLNNYSDVQKLFQSSLSSDNSNLKLINNTSASASMSFTLQIVTDGNGNITGVTANGDSNDFTFSNGSITGKDGTPYAGLTFSYSGTTDATISVNLNQGLADRLSNLLNNFSDTTTGTIQKQIQQLDSTDNALSARASDIRDRADAYRETLIDRYAKMEQAIEANNLLLQQVKAILGASNNSSNG